jgi:hypothetical protein
MINLGRAHDAEIIAVLAALQQGGFYERWLALQACYGSRDGASVLRLLRDPSQTLRDMALRLVALVCDDTQVHSALATLPVKQQHRLLIWLTRKQRYAVIDAFLLQATTEYLPQFLPYGSAPVVARLAEQGLVCASADDWRRLATNHPVIASAMLLRQVQATNRFDQRLLWQANAVLASLIRSAPDQALVLVRALLPHIALAQLAIQDLVFQRPQAAADLVLASGDHARLDFTPVLPRLDAARLGALVARGLLSRPERWLARLAPALRRVAYEAGGLGWRNAEGALPLALVAALPDVLRVAEARRHLRLPALATRPAQRLPYATCLPWDEARATLEPFMRHPDPELRLVAVPALISAARYQHLNLPDVLQVVRLRRYEQDPVQQAMMQALADLPPSRWQVAHLDDLGQIIRQVLDAADCSAATAAAAEHLLLALLPFHPDWCAQWLAVLSRERGQLHTYTLAQRLTADHVRRLVPALLPVFQAWEPRERAPALFHTASLFGRRLEVFPELVTLLERLTRDPRGAVAGQALTLIARYRRDRLPELVPQLLRHDPSWVTRAEVYTFLHRYRQDLLTPFLGQTAYSGRFSTGQTRFVLPLQRDFYRWTPEQQALLAQALAEVTDDEQRDTPTLRTAITQLAALPAIAPQHLLWLARQAHERLAVRDLALRALGRLDAGQGIATLLEALDDARARIAIYALRRVVLHMPVAQALDLLRQVPLEKVTVAKETIRLLGELPGSAAYADLLAFAARELHRDVRVALLRALWDSLEQPETWPVFEQAAVAADPAVAAGVIRIPAERCSPEALRRLTRLLATLLVHPAAEVRLDTLRRCATLPLPDPEHALALPLFQALDAALPDEREAAAGAVFATYAGRESALVGEAIQRILPHRRALMTTVRALQGTLPWNRSRMLPAVRAVLAALTADPLTATVQVELTVAALLWNEFTALLQHLVATDLLHAEVMTAAVTALQINARRAEAADLTALETSLAGASDPRLRRLALAALVAQAQPPRGWDPERLARLQHYGADPVPLVAAAAQFTFPPEEESGAAV